MTTTTERSQKIEIPYPEAGELDLLLRLGPCRLTFHPSEGPTWIAGTYEDASGLLPLEIATGSRTIISQRFDPASLTTAALPRLDLTISRERAFALELQEGASESTFDLGGLPLRRLSVKTGAGRFEIDFSQPNPTALGLLELSTGAGALTARRLANANFEVLRFNGGVAACALDFSGLLSHDASVRIDAGLGSVDLSVPATTALRLRAKSFAAGVRASGALVRRGETYMTPPASEDRHPLVDVEASIAFGALELTTV